MYNFFSRDHFAAVSGRRVSKFLKVHSQQIEILDIPVLVCIGPGKIVF